MELTSRQPTTANGAIWDDTREKERIDGNETAAHKLNLTDDDGRTAIGMRWNKKRNNFSIKNQIFQEFRRCRWCCCCVRVFQEIRWSDRTLFKCKSKMDRRDFVLDSRRVRGGSICVATRRMAFWWHLIDCWFINGHERQIAFNAVISWRFFSFSSYFPFIFLYSLLRFVSNF